MDFRALGKSPKPRPRGRRITKLVSEATDFRGFFNPETHGGDSLEVIAVWSDHIHEVAHVRIGDAVPPGLPDRIFAPIVARGVPHPVKVVDPATHITYYVRRVHGASPVAGDWRNLDWQVPASGGLFLLIAFGVLVVGLMMARFRVPGGTTEAGAEIGMAAAPTPIQLDTDDLRPDGRPGVVAAQPEPPPDASAAQPTPTPASTGAWSVAAARGRAAPAPRRHRAATPQTEAPVLDPITRVEGHAHVVITSTGPRFVQDALRAEHWRLADCMAPTDAAADAQIAFLLDGSGTPGFVQVDGDGAACLQARAAHLPTPPVRGGVLSVRHHLTVTPVDGSPL